MMCNDLAATSSRLVFSLNSSYLARSSNISLPTCWANTFNLNLPALHWQTLLSLLLLLLHLLSFLLILSFAFLKSLAHLLHKASQLFYSILFRLNEQKRVCIRSGFSFSFSFSPLTWVFGQFSQPLLSFGSCARFVLFFYRRLLLLSIYLKKSLAFSKCSFQFKSVTANSCVLHHHLLLPLSLVYCTKIQ